MRGPFVAVAPVVGPMQQDLGFSPVELGLLTGIPVLCFSLAAPLASLAGRKLGAEFAITLTLLGVLAGVIVRSAGGGALVHGRNGDPRRRHHDRQHRRPADHPPRLFTAAPGHGHGHLHGGPEHRLVPDLRGHRAAGRAAGLAACPRGQRALRRGGHRLFWVLAVGPAAPSFRQPFDGSDPRPRRRQAGVPLDHGRPDRGLRRAGLLLLRRDGLAAEPPRRRTRHGARRRRRRVLAVPDPRHRGRPGRAAGGQVRQYDGGRPSPWARCG